MMMRLCRLSNCLPVTPPPDQQIDRQQRATVARLKIVEPELRDNLTVSLPPCEEPGRSIQHGVAKFKRSLVLGTLADPWVGLAAIEQAGLLTATAAESGVEGLPAVIDILEGVGWIVPAPPSHTTRLSRQPGPAKSC